jgi:hypothetical protein
MDARPQRLGFLSLFGLLAALLAGAAHGQAAISLDAFDGWESWPLYAPGDLAVDTSALGPLRIEFDGRFPGPQGFGRGPLDPLTMYMDVIEESFHAQPALWVQWTSRPPAEAAGSPALDMLLVGRATLRLLFRVAASSRGAWAGRYELLQAQPERLVQVSVEEDGTTTREVVEGPADYFDFATYPFLLPFLDLRPGLAFRLSGYDYLEKKPEILPVRVADRTTITDARGIEHEVWRVDVMPSHRATLITFYVAKEAPFFYGWDYRLTRDGSMAVQLTYRGWTSTEVR